MKIGEEDWKAKGDVHDIISASTIVQKGDGRNQRNYHDFEEVWI